MGTVFGASLSPLEKEADLICMESSIMDYKIKSIQDIVSGQYERALMECEYITLRNGGTYDEYTAMVMEAANENTQKQAGIIRTILNAIGQQISRFGDFLQRALGTNNSRMKDVPDDATGTVDGKSATIIDKLLQVGPNLFKQIKQKLAEIEDAIKQHKEVAFATISLSAVGLGVLVKGSKENQEANNAPEKTIDKPTFLDYMNKWAEYQNEFKEINDHGNKLLNMLLAPADVVKAHAEHLAGEKNAKNAEKAQDQQAQDTPQKESADANDVTGSPVMESENNYGLSAYDGLFMEATQGTPSDIDAALAKNDWKTAAAILYSLSSQGKISNSDKNVYNAKINKARTAETGNGQKSGKANNTGSAKNSPKAKSETTKTGNGSTNLASDVNASTQVGDQNSKKGTTTNETKPAAEMPVYNSNGKPVKSQQSKGTTGNTKAGKTTANLASGANAPAQGEEYKNHTKAQTAKTTVDAKNSAIMHDEYKGGTGTASYSAQVGDQKPKKHAAGMEPIKAQPGENEPPKQTLTGAIKGKFTRTINTIKKLAQDDPETARKKAEETMPELKKFTGTEDQQKEMQDIIDKVAADKQAAEADANKSELSKLPWYQQAVTFLKSLLDVTAAVIGATGASMVNAVKGFVSWVKDNTEKAAGDGEQPAQTNGNDQNQQQGQQAQATEQQESADDTNVEGDTITESNDLFGIDDEYKEMTESPSLDELNAFEEAVANL